MEIYINVLLKVFGEVPKVCWKCFRCRPFKGNDNFFPLIRAINTKLEMFWCFRDAFRALTFATVPNLHAFRAYWAPKRQRKVNILEKGWKSQQQQISIFPISLFTCTWNLICWETQSIFQWPFFPLHAAFPRFFPSIVSHSQVGAYFWRARIKCGFNDFKLITTTAVRKREWATTHHSRKQRKNWSDLHKSSSVRFRWGGAI